MTYDDELDAACHDLRMENAVLREMWSDEARAASIASRRGRGRGLAVRKAAGRAAALGASPERRRKHLRAGAPLVSDRNRGQGPGVQRAHKLATKRAGPRAGKIWNPSSKWVGEMDRVNTAQWQRRAGRF